MSVHAPATPSQYALLGSIIGYPLLFYLITPSAVSPARFTKNREAISVLHCTFMTVLSVIVLRSRYNDWVPSNHPSQKSLSSAANDGDLRTGKGHSIIEAKSSFANVLTAIETGYLLQDSLILFIGARLRARHAQTRRLRGDLYPWVLAWHHGGIGGALCMLQWYIARGKEKGVLIIIMFLLMNAS